MEREAHRENLGKKRKEGKQLADKGGKKKIYTKMMSVHEAAEEGNEEELLRLIQKDITTVN